MYTYIKKLQSKPEEVRKQILIGSLVVSMALVGSVWIYNLTDRFGDKKVVVQKSDDITPFKLFMNSASNTFDNISASVGSFSFKEDKINTSPKQEKQIELIPVEPASPAGRPTQ